MAARIPAGGGRRGFASASLTREPKGKRRMDDAEDARARELHNLRLALAMFAVQLEAFELRARRAMPVETLGNKHLGTTGLGKHDWASIRSTGSKSDTSPNRDATCSGSGG